MSTTAVHPVPRAEVTAFPLDDELVVHDPRTGGAYVLNATAARLWSLCDGSRSAEMVVEEIVALYGIDSQVAAVDVAEFLTELAEAGLLTDASSNV